MQDRFKDSHEPLLVKGLEAKPEVCERARVCEWDGGNCGSYSSGFLPWLPM